MKIGKNNYYKNNLVLITNPDYKEPDLVGYSGGYHPSISFEFDAFEDISYEQICRQNNITIPAETIYVCEMLDKSGYEPLEYLEMSQSVDTVYITAEVNFRFSQWSSERSLLSFVESMRNAMRDECSIASKQENLFEEDLLHIKFKLLATQDQNLHSIIQCFTNQLKKIHQSISMRCSYVMM